MNRIKIAKIIVFYILTAVITFSIIFCVYFYPCSHTTAIVLFAVCLFAIDIPLYYLLSFLDKMEEKFKYNFNVTSSEIRHINDNSGDKIREFNGFESIATSLDEVNEREKNFNKTNEILTDILICATKNLELDKFIDSVLDKIMEIISSDWAVFYILNKMTNKLEIKSSKGFGKSIYSQYDITIGEGFIGNAAAKNEVKIINDLPDDTIFIANTFLGKIKPKSLIIVPICDDNNEVLGVFAAASLYTYTKEQQTLLNKIKKYVSYAIENGNYYNKTLRVANELKFQNQLIQNLNDDLESKIKARTTFLNSVINSIKDTAIISVDSRNIITIFNETAQEMLKLSSDDVKGKNIKIISEGRPDFEKKLLNDILEASTNNPVSDIFDLVNKEGRKYEVNMQLFAIYNEVGSVDGVTIVIKDMSDVSKIINSASADKKLTSILFKNSTSAMILANNNGDVFDVNNNALYAFGTTADQIISRNLASFFEDSGKVSEFIKKISESDGESDIEARIIKSQLNVTLLTYPIKNDFTGDIKLLIVLH